MPGVGRIQPGQALEDGRQRYGAGSKKTIAPTDAPSIQTRKDWLAAMQLDRHRVPQLVLERNEIHLEHSWIPAHRGGQIRQAGRVHLPPAVEQLDQVMFVELGVGGERSNCRCLLVVAK